MAPCPSPLATRAGVELSVLVVAADADAGRSYATLLRVTGHSVRTATDCRAAVILAADCLPDVAVIDLDPSKRGSLVKALTSNPPHGRRPLMVAISDCLPAGGNDWPDAGFDACLPKPVDPEILLNLLRRFDRVVAPTLADAPQYAKVAGSNPTRKR